jgi:glycosyltransferase involved in cell wall biosynthesis
VKATHPDIVLMQYPTDAFGRGLLPQLFATVQQIAPLAITLHEFTAAHPLRRIALGPLLARARVVVVTAERERDSLLAWYPWLRRRVQIIPIGTNIAGHTSIPAEPPEIVYFGQIRPHKGLETFLECRDELAERFPQARFRVIGSRVPLFSDYYEQIAGRAAANGVEMLGGLTEGEVSATLGRAACALLPFPGGASFRRSSLLAAASCGVPIVTLAGPDTPAEMMEWLQPPTEPGALAGRVAALLEDPEARRRSSEQSRRVAAHAGWDRITARYMEVLSAAAKRAPVAAVAHS